MSLKSVAIMALASGLVSVASAQTAGKTTRYWDCCKPSCAWSGKADVLSAVKQCDKAGNPLTSGDDTQKNACDGSGGSAYMCYDQTPWAVSADLAYGFAAVALPGGESSTCCSCYELTFTTGAVAGKKMIVQATNTGGDVGSNQFDLAIPGGGTGIYNACSAQISGAVQGKQYGGLDDKSSCSSWGPLADGCNFRFGDWFGGSDNPEMTFKPVTCPKAITDKSGCVRRGETPTGDSAAPASSAAASSAPASSAPASSAPAPSSSDVVSAPAGTLPAVTEAPVPTTSASATSSGSTPAPSGQTCGAKGYDLQKPGTSYFDGSGSYATFDTCKALCVSKSAQSFAFGSNNCYCYAAPVTGNLNPVADSPITFYDIGCTADTPAPTASETASQTAPAPTASETASETAPVPTASETASETSAVPSESETAPYPTGTGAYPAPTGTDASPVPTDAPSEPAPACPVEYVTVYDE